ncbi:hypothetical protein K438DRAFT_2071478 [Mycena galopus ATCC 62051]|nr:hypothetical protein K438DRAFT_2071478 [Mycena galopus ATCC 62051]
MAQMEARGAFALLTVFCCPPPYSLGFFKLTLGSMAQMEARGALRRAGTWRRSRRVPPEPWRGVVYVGCAANFAKRVGGGAQEISAERRQISAERVRWVRDEFRGAGYGAGQIYAQRGGVRDKFPCGGAQQISRSGMWALNKSARQSGRNFAKQAAGEISRSGCTQIPRSGASINRYQREAVTASGPASRHVLIPPLSPVGHQPAASPAPLRHRHSSLSRPPIAPRPPVTPARHQTS